MANWTALTLISVSVGLMGLIIITVMYTITGGYVPFNYGIVLDAGPSHTQVTLYRWLADKDRGTGVVKQLDTCRNEGGISSYDTSDVHTIGYDLLGCVRNVSQKIQKERMFLTPIYLGATAGMRLLNLASPKSVDIILTLIQSAFRLNTGFQVKTIEIVSEQNEGLYSWVTNNYLADKLIVKNPDEFTSTIGLLDMGGVSAQIAYRTGSKGKAVLNGDEVNVKLYGINHTVSASSNLCFGAEQAMLRYQKYLIMAQNSTQDEIASPCLPKGRQQMVSGHEFKDHICLKLIDKSKEIQFDRNYTFVGRSDPTECSRLISDEILSKPKCEQNFEMCFNASEGPPPESAQFYAISHYYSTVRVLSLKQPITAEECRGETTRFCAADNATIFEEWPLVVPKYVDIYCFNMKYIYTTIANVYQFRDRMWSNIVFTEKIQNKELGMSLGFMIATTNAIAAVAPTQSDVTLFPLILVIILCALLLLFAIYFALKIRTNDESHKKGL